MPEAILTKHETLLERIESTPDFERRFGVEFRNGDRDTPNTVTIQLAHAHWQDMGAPTTVTVSVEPGDRLNP